MSDKPRPLPAEEELPRPDESFLQRFHRRKMEARQKGLQEIPDHAGDDVATVAADDEIEPDPEPTDADMPPLESLTADSDYRGFMSSKVSESLRRAALKKLFLSAQFNVIDELDDYAEDFTTFQALGDLVTADMRHQIEVQARKSAEALGRSMLEDESGADEQHPAGTESQSAAAEPVTADAADETPPESTQT